jgi:hypothetical protein
MIAKILNNVQVNIKNIHIRYEDSQSVPEVSQVLPILHASTENIHCSTLLLRVSPFQKYPLSPRMNSGDAQR